MGRLNGALAIFLCGLLVAGGGAALAKAGPSRVDRSFGDKGLVVEYGGLSSGGRYGPYGEDMAVGPEDSIFTLQSFRSCRRDTCTAELFVQRYTPKGVLDASFGEDGASAQVVVTDYSSKIYGGSSYGSLAVNPRGEPVVAAVDGGDVTLFRLDRSGKLARGFGGGDGFVTTDFGHAVVRPQLAISSRGEILVATGFWRRPRVRRPVILARYTPGGLLDPSFGAGTPEAQPGGWLGIRGMWPSTLALSPSGGIALAGSSCCPAGGQDSVYVGRRRSDGSLTRPYAPSRPWRYFQVGRRTQVHSLMALPQGKAYLVGSSGGFSFAARTLASGRLDPAFGRSGVVWLKEMYAGVSPALADRAGRLYVAGFRYGRGEFSSNRAVLARLTRRGGLDRRWGRAPAGYAPLPVWISDALALDFQSSGKLVVFGEIVFSCVRSCPNPGRTLTRLFTGPVPSGR